MAGLQGVGKTTACGKLALYLQKQGKKVLMVATDVYRPAAIDQVPSDTAVALLASSGLRRFPPCLPASV